MYLCSKPGHSNCCTVYTLTSCNKLATLKPYIGHFNLKSHLLLRGNRVGSHSQKSNLYFMANAASEGTRKTQIYVIEISISIIFHMISYYITDTTKAIFQSPQSLTMDSYPELIIIIYLQFHRLPVKQRIISN